VKKAACEIGKRGRKKFHEKGAFMYVCSNPKCKKRIESLDTKFTRCPYCGYRVLYKIREPVAREVSTD